MTGVDGKGALPDAEEIISAAAMEEGFARLASALQPLVDGGNCILLGVMTGGLYPLIRLADRLRGDFRLDYCRATRYGEATTGGELKWCEAPHLELRGQTVIVVDDIYDEGVTLQAVAAHCRQAGARRVVTAVGVVKERSRHEAALPDFTTGLTVPDRYVFGCGMDWHGRWRHLPAVYALCPEAAETAERGNG